MRKIDTRAHGGYVVAPGCPVPPGGYELVDDRDPAELPGWLHQALTPKPPTTLAAPAVVAATNPSGYVSAAVRGEAQRVRTALPGQHNAVLCRAAYALGQLGAAEALTGADCGCTPREVTRVIAAGLAAGAHNPRRSPARTSHRRAA